MNRTFILQATFGQLEEHQLAVTLAQAKALDIHQQPALTLAAIIRANWQVINKALNAFTSPGRQRDTIWPGNDRTVRLEDTDSGDYLPFVATPHGPFFTHENPHSSRQFKVL